MKCWLYGLCGLVLVPALVAQDSVVPQGTRFIGDTSGRYFLSVDCASVDHIPHSNRAFFRTRSGAEAAGYREIVCEPEAQAAAPLVPSPPDPAPTTTPVEPVAPVHEPPVAPNPSSPSEDLSRRRGFWFNVGLGYGSATCDEDFLCVGSEGSVSGTLSLGGTLSQKVLLGVMTNGWVKDDPLIDLNIGTLLGVIRFYPSDGTRFFLQGGLGVGRIDVTVAGVGSGDESGFAALVGLGYDIRVGENLSLTPYLNGFATGTESATWSVGQLGLSLTVH